MSGSASSEAFFELMPDRILDAVEGALGSAQNPELRATGRVLPLNSIENRVYDVELENGTNVVAKFYRPQRWSAKQILEEHMFLHRLVAAEVPAVAPMTLLASRTSELQRPAEKGLTPSLAQSPEGLYFTLFPKVRGRILDELDDHRMKILGRFVARLHAVGAGMPRLTRPALDVDHTGWESLHSLEDDGFLESNMAARYRQTAENLLERVRPFCERLSIQPIHGDAHLGNVLWEHDHPFLLDFDDTCDGPPVQDIWMIIRGNDAEADRQREVLVEAYEEMRPFDRSSLDAVEALRCLRMLRYSAWIGQRWDDPSFQKMFPTFGSDEWWRSEIEALYEVETRLTT